MVLQVLTILIIDLKDFHTIHNSCFRFFEIPRFEIEIDFIDKSIKTSIKLILTIA